jgi:hypothetical protein
MSEPFRLTGEPSEDALHCKVVAMLKLVLLPPAAFTCFPAGNVKLPPEATAKLYRFGLQAGWPDLLVVHGGRIFGIELKSANGHLSYDRMVRTRNGSPRMIEGQRTVFPRLREAGMQIAVCRSTPDVLAALRGWCIPLRGRVAA